MKLSVKFDLPLPEGAEEFIRIIARVHGISSEELSDITDGLEKVCEEQTKALFYNLTISALSAYLGFAGGETIEKIRNHFEANADTAAFLIAE